MTNNTLFVTYIKKQGSQGVKIQGCNMKTKREKALETKKDKLRSRYCLHCDQMIVYDGTQGRKKFCNDACKMAYHRRVKAWEARWAPPQAPKATFDRSAQQIINIAWAHLADVETAL